METTSAPPAARPAPTTPTNGATHALNAPTPAEAEALLARLGQELGARATVDAVFGQPHTIGERTVIPVARIAFGFGGGTGGGAQDRRRRAEQAPEPAARVPGSATGPGGREVAAPQGFGLGGGGGAKAEPVAVVEIGPKGLRVVPVVDVNRLIGRVFTVVFGFAFAALVVSAVASKQQGAGRRRFPLSRAPQAGVGARVTSVVLGRILARARRGG